MTELSGRPTSRYEPLEWFEEGRLGGESAVRQLAQHVAARTPTQGPRPVAVPPRIDGVDAILSELHHLIGLTEIKEVVQELRAFVEVQRRRQACGLAAEPHLLHMAFKGPPGTGKTTVARILGRLFKALEVLPKGHLVEVERADLVGEYIGHTAQKTRDVIRRAQGGILFVDEAYALARGGAKDFGKEATDTLVKAMEDMKDQFVLIFAGYPREMTAFIESNPGLRSRFAMVLEFPDYTPAELVAIARRMVNDRQYRMSPDAEKYLEGWLAANRGRWHPNEGNARLVRNLIERAMRRQAVRLLQLSRPLGREQLMELTVADFAAERSHY